eukprot:Em0010g435a
MLSDCEWVVERCKALLNKNDKNAAKAWILTARSLFPDDFDVQNYVSDLVTEVVSGQDGDKRDIFNLLSNVTQRTLLREAADKAAEVVDRCQILLVELRLFPESATTIGLDMYDQLSQASSSAQLITDNKHRDMLVRQLRLLKCCCADTIPFCTEVIIKTLQDVAFSDPTQDLALGQLVVLLQYNWPREEERFASIITAIQKRKKFSIADYLPYIIGILMAHVYYMLPWFGHIHVWK